MGHAARAKRARRTARWCVEQHLSEVRVRGPNDIIPKENIDLLRVQVRKDVRTRARAKRQGKGS